MFMVRRTLILFLLLFCSAVPAVNALEIIYPADKTVITRADFLIVKGGTTPVADALMIEINGVKSDPIDISAAEYKAAFADFLILEPTWDRGKNTVVVVSYADNKEVGRTRAEIFYRQADDPAAVTPAGFSPYIMHTPEREALCVPCHEMNPTEAQLKGATAENPCASCHKRMFNEKYVHGPEGVFQCVDCHDTRSKPNRWQITKPELTLCGECHTDKIEEFKKNKYVHGPVASGNCTVCHDAHASGQPAQLTAPVNRLCLGCHSDISDKSHVTRGVSGKNHPVEKVPDPLRPGRQLSCASCHNPHGGAATAFFRQGVLSSYALCQICHKK